MKGTHHYVKCLDPSEIDWVHFDTEYEEYISIVCLNGYEKFTTVGDNPYENLVPFNLQQNFLTDNLKVHIMALDCEFIDTIFVTES